MGMDSESSPINDQQALQQTDVKAKLKKLKDLFDNELIFQEDYEGKKKKLLEEL